MKLNCNQGDLAVVVRSECGNEGKIVRCLRAALPGEIHKSECKTAEIEIATLGCWVVDQLLEWKMNPLARSTKHFLAKDAVLRPLRPGEGDDETLAWAGKPEQVAA